MNKITENLRLRSECGWSYQRIGATLNISKTAAHRHGSLGPCQSLRSASSFADTNVAAMFSTMRRIDVSNASKSTEGQPRWWSSNDSTSCVAVAASDCLNGSCRFAAAFFFKPGLLESQIAQGLVQLGELADQSHETRIFVNLPTGLVQCVFRNAASTLSGIDHFFQLPALVTGITASRTVAVGLPHFRLCGAMVPGRSGPTDAISLRN